MKFYSLLLSTLLLMAGCTKGKKSDEVVGLEKPTVVSSSFENGATNIAIGEQTIIITYDQNITLPNASAITLNQADVLSASAAFKELRVRVALNPANDYTLVIPTNTIKGPTGLFADELRISFTTIGNAEQTITAQLVTENPTPEVQKVYDFLRENYGSKVISGTMANVNWNINEADWVHKHTGKYPALNCFDYIHLYASPANWINYEETQVVENWWADKGLVAAMWHWNVPSSEGSNSYNFYTEHTSFDASRAVIDGTYENTVVKNDLEKIANHLLLLKEKNIPIIWRPLHEAAGKWFWWGAKGPEPSKKLWVMMFEAFRKKGLNNLIWVWTSETDDQEWYPGDAYVDIIGCDLYNRPTASQIASIYENLTSAHPNKIITLSEFGNLADLTEQWNSGAKWSWVMPWYDYDRTVAPLNSAFDSKTHTHADINYWTKLFADEHVITRDRMPDLK